MNAAHHTVYLSLGSNVGDRLLQLRKAVTAIEEISMIKKISSVYETSPVGPIAQNDFLNLVLEIQTDMSPYGLMVHLMRIEENHGRQRNLKWGPRSIDIDIVFYDQMILNISGLVIPHAHYAERRFVLEPLCEIAPQWICPVRQISVYEIRRRLTDIHAVKKMNNLTIDKTVELN
ncbi:2-amino-4-hydroxy-6-hydroxymethyldihydropteridine diphosphokinase [bacterium]|nr:2-amino-4-hydroxy-6-hydroxymethyldihydropteridine diphosphokinase [bacterium]